MQPDSQLRAATRAVYETCFSSEEWAPCGFDEAEQFETVHYRNARGAAERAKAVLVDHQTLALLAAVL